MIQIARHTIIVFAFCFPFLLAESSRLHAFQQPQTEQPATSVEEPAVEDELARIQKLVTQVETTEQLDDPSKASIKQQYNDAIEALKAKGELQKTTTANQQKAEQAPATIKTAREAYEKSPPEFDPIQYRGWVLEQVDPELKALRQELANEEKNIATLDQERLRRTTRRKEIPVRLEAIEGELQQLQSEATRLANTPDGGPAIAARSEFIRQQSARLLAEKQMLESEILRYDAENDLLPLQADLARRKAVNLRKKVEFLDSRMSFLRKSEAEQQVIWAEQYAQQFLNNEELTEIASNIREMAEQRIGLTGKLSAARDELKARQEALESLQTEYERTQTRVDNLGATSSVGSLLRKQQAEMPAPDEIHDRIQQRQTLIRNVELDLYEAVDQRKEFADPDARASEFGEQDGLDTDDVLPLMQLQREVAADLEGELEEYFESLVELNTTSKSTLEIVTQFSDFVDRNILWIRSGEPVWEMNFADLQKVWATVFQPASWQSILPTLIEEVKANAFLTAFMVLLLAVGFWKRRAMRKAIDKQATIVAPATSTKFKPTFVTLLLTMAVAATWPILLLTIGWLLRSSSNQFAFAWGVAFGHSAMSVFGIEFIRQTCRRDGLALSHFRWPNRVVVRVRRYVRLAIFFLVPLGFLHAYVQALENEVMRESVARLFFTVTQAFSIFFIFQLFRPDTGVFQEHMEDYPDGWMSRLRFVWFGFLLIVPITMLGMSVYGYHYTAEQLDVRMRLSVGILLVLMVISGLLTRWVLISRRRLRLQQMRERLSQSGVDVAGIPIDGASDVDLRTINVQSKRLIRSTLVIAGLIGIYAVWSSVLPALQALDSVRIWQVGGGEGQPPTDVTLKNLLFLLPIIAATVVAARNGPGLLEIVILQKLPLDSSVRYAITTLVSYIVVTIGIIAASNAIGIQWSSVQWLVAALGVGLGFGLQEIFANFVSGIILLFERPIRVGDVVTLGDVTGVVSNIRIRATTITNWDRQDFVVPNKDLVTGRLLNWTLTDDSSRITVNVGVSYSSNPETVTRLLYEVLEQHPLILDDPAPLVTFENFADSSLLFVIRAHVGSLSVRLQAIHQMHAAIFSRFDEEGIEIAFPQLDLHVRSVAARDSGAITSAATSNGSGN